jgi:hypothetical protein
MWRRAGWEEKAGAGFTTTTNECDSLLWKIGNGLSGMTKDPDIFLHSDFPRDACDAKIEAQIDFDRGTLLSLSGYRGTRPILGRIAGSEFRLHKRRYWHNSFGPVLFGRVITDGQGSRMEGS